MSALRRRRCSACLSPRRSRPGSVHPGGGTAAELHASLERVRLQRAPDILAVRSQPRPLPESGGGFEARYLSPVSSPVVGADGRLAGILHRLQDVTEYVRLSRQQAQELERRTRPTGAENATNDFLERLAHELRTPLSTIVGFGELLTLDDARAEHREWTSMMLAAANRLVQILDESLDVSRIATSSLSLSMEAVPVYRVIADVLELIRPLSIARGVRVDPPPPDAAGFYVHADDQRLRQILLNLLSNAIKYNHPAGNVSVTVGRADGGRLRISVADTGRGIEAEDLGRLFLPFERLDAAQAGIGGTGLGLALSRDLVVAMGGAAGVTSTPGVGSTFWIELASTEPLAVAQLAVERSAIAETRRYSHPRTVLYVEDMVENLQLVKHILRQRPSVSVIPAMLAGVALDLARQHHPDLILLDLQLPDMPGEDVLSLLQDDPACADIPVAVLSADTSRHRAALLTADGAAAYLAKPISVRSLLETVDSMLGESAPTAHSVAGLPAPDDQPGGS